MKSIRLLTLLVFFILCGPAISISADVAVLYDYTGSMADFSAQVQQIQTDLINLITTGSSNYLSLSSTTPVKDPEFIKFLGGTPLASESDNAIVLGFHGTNFYNRLTMTGTTYDDEVRMFPFNRSTFESALNSLYPSQSNPMPWRYISSVREGTHWELAQCYAIRLLSMMSGGKRPIYIFMLSDFKGEILPTQNRVENQELLDLVTTSFNIQNIYTLRPKNSPQSLVYVRVYRAEEKDAPRGGVDLVRIDLVSPSDKKEFKPKSTVTFNWKGTGVTLFNLHVRKIGTQQPDYGKDNINATTFTTPTLSDGTYEWYVTSYIAPEIKSQTWSFTVGEGGGGGDGKPEILLQSPPDGRKYDKDNKITLTWNVTGKRPDEFTVTVTKTTGRVKPKSEKTKNLTFTIPEQWKKDLGGGTYKWTVSGGGATSKSRNFTVTSDGIGPLFVLLILGAIGGLIFWLVQSGKLNELRKRFRSSGDSDQD